MSTRVLIVEDYPAIARSLERHLREALGDRLESLEFVRDLPSAVESVRRRAVDLVLLDLNLGGQDGFDLLPWASAGGFHTIVVSANTHRAIEAFEHGVLDFVPKPVDPDRLRQALARFEGAPGPDSPTRHLAVRSSAGFELISLADVRHIAGAGKYSELQLQDGRRKLHDKSLERLDAVLPSSFLRVHRSHIVNLEVAREIRVHGGGSYQLELDDGVLLPVSRTRYGALRDLLA